MAGPYLHFPPRDAYTGEDMATKTSLTAIFRRALGRPRVFASLLRAAWRFRARGWWRRPPFLPVPPREFIAWRLHTAYGEDASPTVDELARYLRWANRMMRTRRGPIG